MSTQLTLPNATNKHAQMVRSRVDVLRGFLPPHLKPNAAQFFSAAINEINRLPENCTQASITVCIVNACVIGLIPGPALGHCHFVPFKQGKGDNERNTAQLIVGYKGFIELAFANRFLKDVNPEVVLAGESVRRWHDINGPQIMHELPEHRPEPTRANVVGAYCTWHTIDGGRGYFWRSKDEIDRVDRGPNSKTPWATDYRSMALKSAIRPASKLWRLTQDVANAVMLDEQAERGEAQSAIDSAALEAMAGIEQQADPTRDDAMGNLAAFLKHKVGCETKDEQEAVIRYLTGQSLAEASVEEINAVSGRVMTWERDTGKSLKELLAAAKSF